MIALEGGGIVCTVSYAGKNWNQVKCTRNSVSYIWRDYSRFRVKINRSDSVTVERIIIESPLKCL